jgi:hypothetical protein
MSEADSVPVVLFAYNRPDHLRRTLEALRQNEIPLLYVFSDGPKSPEKAADVAAVREVLRAIDWCETRITERSENLGLGRSIRTGVTEIFRKHESAIVVEDDLICVPGAYRYMCAALRHYRDDLRVMSITGWTHPRVTPPNLDGRPYFDGRAECLLWGTWARSWGGMDREASALVRDCVARGIDIYEYGADLVIMSERELATNIWAVRFIFLHRLSGGLCLRPPHTLVEHIGWDELATNAKGGDGWSNPPLLPCPALPTSWPAPIVDPACSRLWQQAVGGRPVQSSIFTRALRKLGRIGSQLRRPSH